jgi:hypothetical protein
LKKLRSTKSAKCGIELEHYVRHCGSPVAPAWEIEQCGIYLENLYFCKRFSKIQKNITYMKKSIIIGLAAAIILLSACGNGKKSPTFKVDNFSNGKAGELILVMSDDCFTDNRKDSVIRAFTQPQPAINQIEPMFDLLKFQPKDFTPYFQRHRGIVQFDVDNAYSSNTFSIDKNVWAAPQVVVRIKGNNADSCLALFYSHRKEIIDQFYDNDLKRLQSVYKNEADASVQKILRDKFGIQIDAPAQYFIASQEDNFLWLRYKTARNDRFIMVYKTPMTALSRENLIAARNEITQKHIPGAVRGSYPVIADTYGLPNAHPLAVGSKQGMEMRGLWESVNDKMGGPFYSFSFLDPAGQYCISVDGFVYAPQENKRDYLREVEAIVKSVR